MRPGKRRRCSKERGYSRHLGLPANRQEEEGGEELRCTQAGKEPGKRMVIRESQTADLPLGGA